MGRGLLPRRHQAERQALRSPCATSTRCRPSIRSWCITAAGTPSFYNSKAFELAKVTKDTPNPPGGTFDRDANGKLNGRVTDLARNVFADVGTRPTFTPKQRATRERDGIAHISKQFVRYGLTSVHHQGGDLAAIQDVRARGDLLHRVSYEAERPGPRLA